MAIQSTDIVVSELKGDALGHTTKVRFGTLSFPSGLTYDTGGFTLPIAAMGLPSRVWFLGLNDRAAIGYKEAFNQTNNRLLLMVPTLQTAAATADGVLDQSATGDAKTRQSIRPLINEAGTSLAVGFISADANATYRLPTLIEVATGDTLTSCTWDFVAYGY